MWTKTTLGESCKMYQPKTISAKEMVSDGEYAVFGANGIIGRYDKFNHTEPQLLVTCRGATCGSVNVSEPNSWITGNAMVIQPEASKISMRFMEYVCRGGIDLSKAITGAAQPQITRKSLEPIEFSYPTLAEQQRIVAKLDAAFAEIDKAIELNNWRAEQSKQLLQRIIDTEFASKADSVSFDSLVKIKGTGLERRANLQSSDKEFPYLKMNNISSDNTLNLEGFTAVDASVDEVDKYTLEDGDFLFNTRNSVELVGKTAVVRGIDGWLFNNNILRVKFTDNIHPDYVNDYFCSGVGKKQLEDRKTGTTNVAAIYYKDLKTVEIPIISIEQQSEIVSKIAKARTLNTSLQKNYSSAKEQLCALKSALLKQELKASEVA